MSIGGLPESPLHAYVLHCFDQFKSSERPEVPLMKKSLSRMREYGNKYGVRGKRGDQMLDEEMALKLQGNQAEQKRLENIPAQSRVHEDKQLAVHSVGICRARVSSLVVCGQDTLRPLHDTEMRIKSDRMVLLTDTYHAHALMWVYHLAKEPVHTGRKSIHQQRSPVRL